jgi:AcrR family transcriptional regulator
MSPQTKVTKQQWLTTALSQGQVPADLPLGKLCQLMGISKGSFYNYFDTLEQFYGEVIEQWRHDSAANSLASSMQAVRDPLERLRLLQAVTGETALRDVAMRRWAAYDPRAAAAVAEVDKQIKSYVATALSDLGFPQAEAAVLTEVLMHAMSGGLGVAGSPARRRTRPAASFETLLAIIARAAPVAGFLGEEEVGVAPGLAPDEQILILTKGLPPDRAARMRDQAQQFFAALAEPGDAQLPGAAGGPAAAEQGQGA